ncbi:hypothetical protein [Neptunomonas antarctica]|uniref:Coenzyme PQQ synthesis protein D (PqqD) n=1 Tax=Neptunomonas antarctica TaxID=619304 RepID=A0A1N7J7U6_9GAMM|nr:hypothetical protein [Neptunomonas antarctica]SIS45438.1 hypothetical protein SAMN05421760_101741 [Neptunomonas antarctica]
MTNSQYFYRTVIYTRKDNEVGLADINQPDNVTPLDEWLGLVVSLADGSHTIQELLDYVSKRYPTPPPNLEATLHSVIERLEEGNLIKLSESPVALPYYLAEPIEALDVDKARQLIEEDGYRVH